MAEEAEKQLGWKQAIALFAAFVAPPAQIGKLWVEYKTLQETRKLNGHVIQKDMRDYILAYELSKETEEAAKQTAEAAEGAKQAAESAKQAAEAAINLLAAAKKYRK